MANTLAIYSLKRPMGKFPDELCFDKCLKEDHREKSVLVTQVHKTTGVRYTIKSIRTKFKGKEQRLRLEEDQFQYLRLSHPNILRLYYTYTGYDRWSLVYEGTVDVLAKDIDRRQFYSEQDAKVCVRQLLDAVDYCHDRRLVHRNLHPWNMLITSEDWSQVGAMVKLTGLEGMLEMKGLLEQQYGIVTDHGCAAPEMWNGRPYGQQVDAWGVGLTLYWLLAGHHPFLEDLDNGFLGVDISRGWFMSKSAHFAAASRAARSMVKRLLVPCPKERMTVQQAIEHRWLSDCNEQDSVVSDSIQLEPGDIDKSGTSTDLNQASVTSACLQNPPHDLVKNEVLVAVRSFVHSLDTGRWQHAGEACSTSFQAVVSLGNKVKKMDLRDYLYYFKKPEVQDVFVTQLHSPSMVLVADDAVLLTYTKTQKDKYQGGELQVVFTCIESALWKKQGGTWQCCHIQQSNLERSVLPSTVTAGRSESRCDSLTSDVKKESCPRATAPSATTRVAFKVSGASPGPSCHIPVSELMPVDYP